MYGVWFQDEDLQSEAGPHRSQSRCLQKMGVSKVPEIYFGLYDEAITIDASLCAGVAVAVVAAVPFPLLEAACKSMFCVRPRAFSIS